MACAPRVPSRCAGTAPPGVVALDLSENSFAPLPAVVAAVAEAAARINRYPEFEPMALTGLVSEWVGAPQRQVVVGSGATGVAMQILSSFGVRGSRLVMAEPNFDGYAILASVLGIAVAPVPLDADGTQDLPALADAVRSRSDVVVVCRPHNPTGTVVGEPELIRFLDDIAHRATVILDEAYAEFLPTILRVDPLALIERYPRLIVLRTFSKAYGLAGIRVGYGIGSAAAIDRIRAAQVPFAVNAIALPAVSASIAAQDELHRRVREIGDRRDRLQEQLRARGVRVPVSNANFLFLPGAGIGTALLAGGVRGKEYRGVGVRVGVGSPAANAAVLAALASVFPAP